MSCMTKKIKKKSNVYRYLDYNLVFERAYGAGMCVDHRRPTYVSQVFVAQFSVGSLLYTLFTYASCTREIARLIKLNYTNNNN